MIRTTTTWRSGRLLDDIMAWDYFRWPRKGPWCSSEANMMATEGHSLKSTEMDTSLQSYSFLWHEITHPCIMQWSSSTTGEVRAWMSNHIPLFYINVVTFIYRVSHNQGYHLVCTWGQKWSFLHCPKNNCTWKCIDYSVWNPNFAKLSLIFIEIYKFENPSLTRHFRVGTIYIFIGYFWWLFSIELINIGLVHTYLCIKTHIDKFKGKNHEGWPDENVCYIA